MFQTFPVAIALLLICNASPQEWPTLCGETRKDTHCLTFWVKISHCGIKAKVGTVQDFPFPCERRKISPDNLNFQNAFSSKTSKHIQSCVASQLWSKCGQVKFYYHTETSITAEGRTLYTVPQLSSTGAQGEKTRCSEPLRQPRSQNTALLSFQVRVHLSSDLQESFNKVWPNASIGKRNSFYFYPSTFDSLYPLSPSSHMKNWKKKSGKITNLARINWNPHALWEAKWFSYYRKEYGSS